MPLDWGCQPACKSLNACPAGIGGGIDHSRPFLMARRVQDQAPSLYGKAAADLRRVSIPDLAFEGWRDPA